MEQLLDKHVPIDVRGAVSHAWALGVLPRSIIVERKPIYRQKETVHQINQLIKMIHDKYSVGRYLKVKRAVREEHSFRQARRGRPGPETAYRKITKRRFDIEWSIDE